MSTIAAAQAKIKWLRHGTRSSGPILFRSLSHPTPGCASEALRAAITPARLTDIIRGCISTHGASQAPLPLEDSSNTGNMTMSSGGAKGVQQPAAAEGAGHAAGPPRSPSAHRLSASGMEHASPSRPLRCDCQRVLCTFACGKRARAGRPGSSHLPASTSAPCSTMQHQEPQHLEPPHHAAPAAPCSTWTSH